MRVQLFLIPFSSKEATGYLLQQLPFLKRLLRIPISRLPIP